MNDDRENKKQKDINLWVQKRETNNNNQDTSYDHETNSKINNDKSHLGRYGENKTASIEAG